ncbi:MAG: hypothetical protein ABEI99_01975 [Halobaculum sp.]
MTRSETDETESKESLAARIEHARETMSPGEETTIRKSAVTGRLPDAFDHSLLSYQKDANDVFRDGRSERTLQIREYDDRYVLQMDAHHPLAAPVAHFRNDVPPSKQAMLAVGVLAAVAVGGVLLL